MDLQFRILWLMFGSLLVPPLRLLTERFLISRSAMWQAVPGVVERSIQRSIMGLWIVNVYYMYSVGETYKGLRLVRYVTKKGADSVISKFAAGTSISVRFNPVKPAQSIVLIEDPGHQFTDRKA